MDGEVDDFLAWLRARGTPEPNLELYRRGAAVLAQHATLDATLAAEEAAGASPRRLANLREVHAQLMQFRAEPPPPPEIHVAPRPQRATAVGTRPAPLPPRRGCECRERKDVYLDDDLGLWGKAAGGITGVVGLVMLRMIGVLGTATVIFGLAGCGSLAAAMSMGYRCDTCRRSVRDLDDDERADLRRGRGLRLIVALVFLAGAAICVAVWFGVMRERYR